MARTTVLVSLGSLNSVRLPAIFVLNMAVFHWGQLGCWYVLEENYFPFLFKCFVRVRDIFKSHGQWVSNNQNRKAIFSKVVDTTEASKDAI